MPDFLTTNGHTQVIVPLTVMPSSHQALPTITGRLFSQQAGAVLYGHYNMEYLLPGGDTLRLIANHDKKTVQFMLFTRKPELIKLLPGERASSLVANTINKIHRYRIRSESYQPPLSPEQEQKRQLANQCISSLNPLLRKERRVKFNDYEGQEKLRRKVIQIIEQYSDKNRLLANNPLISEGVLGDLLYESHKAAQHHAFNRVYSVSRQDQMDFSKIKKNPENKKEPLCIVWDSELHIGHDSKDLDDALRVICQYYQLTSPPRLSIPANRFAKFAAFFQKLWRDGHDWINFLTIKEKPEHKTEVQERIDGVSVTQITPYYRLQGLPQKGYPDLKSLMAQFPHANHKPAHAKNTKKAQQILSQKEHGCWVIIPSEQHILLRQHNELLHIRYFVHKGQFYPLPDGQDLYTLGQVSKRHLYLPERVSLRLKAFASRIPNFFHGFFKSMKQFIVHDLHEEFFNHVHASHTQYRIHQEKIERLRTERTKVRNSLVLALESNGFLTNGQTLEEFIKEQIHNSPYVIAQANHPPSPPAYDNPLHKALDVIRHIAGFFIDTSERDPLIGTLAIAAYAYGGGAILAPEALKAVLTKLHLQGLISGIEPTQRLAHWINHGRVSEATTASALYWQGVVAGGNLDKFFVDAILTLKEDPAELAIITALALSLGYGLTRAIPALAAEMGDFPYTNYAAIGGKGGAAIYDTIMHPGDDWFLGTCKWLCKGTVALAKVFITPFFEWHHYGFTGGFLNGWKKSGILFKRLSKQTLAASLDLALSLLTLPLLELSAILIHVPFRGITNLLTKVLSILSHLSAVGELLLAFATRPPAPNYMARFRLSPLYGFSSPFGHFSDNPLINLGINALRALCLPLLQLLKNVIILPIIDLMSVTVRVGITLINPPSRALAYVAGSIFCTFGNIWDKSIGILFAFSAKGVTLFCNLIDSKASILKQNMLSLIQINRSHLFHWAFGEDDKKLHTALNDEHYYYSDPRRCELIPHSDSHCLLHTLLSEQDESPLSEEEELTEQHYSYFFQAPKSTATPHASAQNQPIKSI